MEFEGRVAGEGAFALTAEVAVHSHVLLDHTWPASTLHTEDIRQLCPFQGESVCVCLQNCLLHSSQRFWHLPNEPVVHSRSQTTQEPLFTELTPMCHPTLQLPVLLHHLLAGSSTLYCWQRSQPSNFMCLAC